MKAEHQPSSTYLLLQYTQNMLSSQNRKGRFQPGCKPFKGISSPGKHSLGKKGMGAVRTSWGERS